MEASKRERYLYIDYLRLIVIGLVVMIHLACTYSNIGSWYYYEEGSLGLLSTFAFGIFQSFTQAYFMGFMFLLSGFFVPAAYDKKGFGKFIKDRVIRLGIPALIYMLIIHPFIGYVILADYYGVNKVLFFKEYLQKIITLDFLGDSGPLWFAFALLIFCIVYAFVRRFSKKEVENGENPFPDLKTIFILIGTMGSITFLIRIIQPIGTQIVNMQLCFFTQYIMLFVIGIRAYRYNWLEQINYSWGIKWLRAAFIAWPLILIGLFIGTGAVSKGIDGFNSAMGGLHIASLIYSIGEAFIAIAMSIGLIALFKEKFNRPNRLFKTLSENAFTVYMFHAPIIIYLSFVLRNWNLPPLIKFAVMCIIDLPTCFIIAHFILRKIPLLKKVL